MKLGSLRGRGPILLGRALRPLRASDDPALRGEDWVQANPRRIERSLARVCRRPDGGWFVLDASRTIANEPRGFTVAGRELVAWRTEQGELRVAPDSCPHMGARLSEGRVCGDKVVCPWHGLELGAARRGRWALRPAYDDGVLAWVRLDELARGKPTDAPILPERPARFIDAVIRVEARCEPQDVIANRLDPWHGAWFHPYSFSTLRVTDRDEDDDVLHVRVSKRLLGRLAIEVDAKFHCPDPRTIVMTITDGEGVGSVVETHATPLGDGRTAIIEASLATSERAGFGAARRIAPLIRPFMRRSARRLWVDDAAYAERLYELREQEIDAVAADALLEPEPSASGVQPQLHR